MHLQIGGQNEALNIHLYVAIIGQKGALRIIHDG
jgi:hypothetical protein